VSDSDLIIETHRNQSKSEKIDHEWELKEVRRGYETRVHLTGFAGGLCDSIVICDSDDDDLGPQKPRAAALNTGKAAAATKADAG